MWQSGTKLKKLINHSIINIAIVCEAEERLWGYKENHRRTTDFANKRLMSNCVLFYLKLRSKCEIWIRQYRRPHQQHNRPTRMPSKVKLIIIKLGKACTCHNLCSHLTAVVGNWRRNRIRCRVASYKSEKQDPPMFYFCHRWSLKYFIKQLCRKFCHHRQ